MADQPAVSIDRLPTLTEVLELGRDLQTPAAGGFGEPPLLDLALAVPVLVEFPISVSAPTPAPMTPPFPMPVSVPVSVSVAAHVGAATAVPDSPVDEDAVVARVLADLEPRVAALLEARVSEALAPAMARFSDALIRESRLEISGALRSLVQESLEQALRHRDEYR